MSSDRTKPYSRAEFAALRRNSDGDIMDLEDHYPYISAGQREQLSEDDWSRMEDLDEEVRCLLAEF